MKNTVLFLFFCFVFKFLSAQSSFQYEIAVSPYRLDRLLVDENDEVIALYPDNLTLPSQESSFCLTKINNMGEQTVGFKFKLAEARPIFPYAGSFEQDLSLWMSATYDLPYDTINYTGSCVFAYNWQTDTNWAYFIGNASPLKPDFAVNEELETIACIGSLPSNHGANHYEEQVLQFYNISATGSENWSKGLTISNNFADNLVALLYNIEEHPNNDLYISGKLIDTAEQNESLHYIMHLDENANSIAWKTIEIHELTGLKIAEDGAIYLYGKTAAAASLTNNTEDAILIKMDADLNVIWSKIYYADAFDFVRFNLNLKNDGTPMIGYSTFGAFPVILANLDESGNILWEKGYPYFEPKIHVLSDGALLMSVEKSFDATGGLTNTSTVIQTDAEGNVEGCEDFPACLSTMDVMVTFGADFEVTPREIDTLVPLTVEQEPWSFELEEVCNIPAPPSPEFDVPIANCPGETIITTNTYNHLAHGIEWHLQGGNIDSIIIDSLALQIENLPEGDYLLAQTIWFLGCDYSHEQTFSITEVALPITIETTSFCTTPATLTAVAAENLNYTWQNGATTPELIITESGMYEVTVSDGFCYGIATTEVLFVDEYVGDSALLLLPDVTLCPVDLPYNLQPESVFSDTFILNNTTEATHFELYETGTYEVGTTILGCPFSINFDLQFENCEARLYLPNAFSPNNDGVNDIWKAEGKGFEPLRLQVFDRWGNLLYDGKETAVFWNGFTGNTAMPGAVYTVVFNYFNTSTLEIEAAIQSVTLIR